MVGYWECIGEHGVYPHDGRNTNKTNLWYNLTKRLVKSIRKYVLATNGHVQKSEPHGDNIVVANTAEPHHHTAVSCAHRYQNYSCVILMYDNFHAASKLIYLFKSDANDVTIVFQ